MHRLLFADTLFQYSMRYRTTWHGTIVTSDGRGKPVYNMIDYIVIREQCKPLVIKAGSYSGTETFSDYRLVIADMELTDLFKFIKHTVKLVLMHRLLLPTSKTF